MTRLGVAERREAVLGEVLKGNGNVRTLSSRLAVSEATVRRDLTELSARGRIMRTYGGAVSGPRHVELTLRQKESEQLAAKQEIARTAAGLVRDGDILIVDAGTTTGWLAKELGAGQKPVVVATNGINSLVTLSECDNVETIVLGGALRVPTQAVVGSMAENSLRFVMADLAFLGTNGIIPGQGLSCPTLEQASLKSLMADRAREVVVLADSTKIGRDTDGYIAPIRRRYTVITDDAISAEARRRIEQDPLIELRVSGTSHTSQPIGSAESKHHQQTRSIQNDAQRSSEKDEDGTLT